MTICVNHVVIVLSYLSNAVSLNFTLNATFTCAMTNIIHQNSDFSQFLSHAHSHSAEVNDVICRPTVNRTSTFIFSNFRYPGPKIPEITLKTPRFNVHTGKQVCNFSSIYCLSGPHNCNKTTIKEFYKTCRIVVAYL